MSEFVERRKGGDRRKGPTRTGEDRRTVKLPAPAEGPVRGQTDRRRRERRSGVERRKATS